ncbi:MAG: DUF975 family protein [Clostridia bacterium]|nr:DUF975 family protein [Clostridia bacterium]
MKISEDFRAIARNSLKGKWSVAVIAGLVASLLGGVDGGSSALNINLDTSGGSANVDFAGQTLFSTDSGLGAVLAGSLIYIAVAALILGIVYFVLGSFIGVGYAKFNLNINDGKPAGYDTLFAYASVWKTTALARLLQAVYILLWSLLFIIPGIAASYSYAMTAYILAENPEISASEAIDRSKEMMRGNRLRLFCLQFSFIGWSILSALTLGIGNLWLNPYMNAATAAFYREVSDTEFVNGNYVAFDLE